MTYVSCGEYRCYAVHLLGGFLGGVNRADWLFPDDLYRTEISLSEDEVLDDCLQWVATSAPPPIFPQLRFGEWRLEA